jgi:3-dehydroquinate dehydratase-2
MKPRIHLLNGPNLNLLGTREPEIYGSHTLQDVENMSREAAGRHGLELICRQTNAEHQLVEWIQEARHDAGIILNPAAFTYHAISVLDALRLCDCPIIEVHISNIFRREAEWRAHSIICTVATAMMTGFGVRGYVLAVEHLAVLIARGTRPCR